MPKVNNSGNITIAGDAAIPTHAPSLGVRVGSSYIVNHAAHTAKQALLDSIARGDAIQLTDANAPYFVDHAAHEARKICTINGQTLEIPNGGGTYAVIRDPHTGNINLTRITGGEADTFEPLRLDGLANIVLTTDAPDATGEGVPVVIGANDTSTDAL